MSRHTGDVGTFHAYLNTSMHLGGYDPIEYDTVLYNPNGDYDPETGTFTCPVRGVYLFAHTATIPERSDELSVQIRRNNFLFNSCYIAVYNRLTDYNSGSTVCIVACSPGDLMVIRKDQEPSVPIATAYGAMYSSLSVFLIAQY